MSTNQDRDSDFMFALFEKHYRCCYLFISPFPQIYSLLFGKKELLNSFFNYILFIMLLQLSQFSPFALFHTVPPTPSDNPHTIVHVHGSCIQVLWLLLSYTVLYIIRHYLYVLNPLTSSPTAHTALPSGNYQNTLHIHDSVLICLV